MKNHTLFVRLLFATALVMAFAAGLSAQALTIASSLPGGVENASYPPQALVTGGTSPYTYTTTPATGALPAGLSLSTTNGILSGTPAVGSAGTYNFALQVKDSATPANTASKSLTIVVTKALSITPITLPNGVVGTSYSPQTLTANDGTAPYSFSVISGALPSNLTLSGGVISGTPVVSGVFAFTVRAIDSSSPSQTAQISLSINVPPSITTTSLPNGAVGAAYSQTLTFAPGTATPYTWSVSSGALPTGLSLDTAQGTISGTPTTAGNFNFTITATDTASKTGSQALSMTIQPKLQITATSPLPLGVVGVFYSQVIGTGPSANWAAISGTLPPGLSLTSTGSLTGSPSTSGAFDFTVQANGGTPPQTSGTQAFHIVINPALSITTLSPLVGATLNAAYSTTLTASGGVAPYTWSNLGSLPPGLNLSSGGVLSGTPTVPGNYSLTIQVADSFSPVQTNSRSFSLTVASTLTITTSSLPNGAPGSAYSQTLSTAAGTAPFSWSVTAGSLPTGMNLSAAGGVISGTPTASGTFNFTVTVTDSSIPVQTTSKALSIIIITPTLTITTASPLPVGVSGVFYSQQLAATGASGLNWSQAAGVLPPGLSLTSSGSLTGNPGVSGTFAFTIQVTGGDPLQTAKKDFQLAINPALTITTASPLPGATLSAPYSTTLVATGGVSPYTWTSQSSLPPGLSLSSAGVLSGTPTVPNNYTLTVQAADSFTPQQLTSRTFTLAVSATLTITTSSLPNGLINTAYSQSLAVAGGTAPYSSTLSAGSLPAGLTLSNAGLISGTPTAAGTSNFTVLVTDSTNQTTSKGLSITIVQQTLTITTTSPLAVGVVGAFYSQVLAATGVSPVTWSQISGTLPPGLSVSASGSLTGTPAVSGSFDFTLQAAGGNPLQTVSAPFHIDVNAALTITTVALSGATLNVSYSQQLSATGGLGTYTWTNLSNLPPGLTLDKVKGIISGTPTVPGNYPVAIQVSDSSTPAQTAKTTFNISVATTLSITTSTLPNGAVGTAYSQNLAAAAGTAPYNWSASSGLPGGLSISTDGIVSGTPAAAGTFTVNAVVSDSSTPAQSTAKSITLIIQPLLSITTASQLPLGVVGAFYSQTLAATGTSALTWSVLSGSLPPGLGLGNGTLLGTPSISGAYDFTVQVAGGDPAQTAKQSFHLVINAALTMTAATLPDAGLGNFYSFSFAATGGVSPYAWTNQGNLPPGLSLSNSGVVSGTPIGLGNFTFSVTVTDSFSLKQTATRSFTLVVATTVSITTTSLSNGIQNQAYSQQMQAVGTAPFTWVVTSGTLPNGLTLTLAGVLQGTPTAVGAATFTVGVTDARGTTSTQTFTLVVDPPVATLSIPALPATLNPTQLSQIVLTLSDPHPSDLSGQLILTFTSKAEVPSDDPMTEFSTGSRTVSFTIPANTTTAVFAAQQVSLLTGTVAGTVTLTATIQNGPSNVPVAKLEIPAIAPQMTNVTASRTAGGIQVQITGYASSRRVNTVEFDFDVKSGSTVQHVAMTRDVQPDFNSWFANPASTTFGGSFSFEQTFTVAGDATQIQSVTVRLTNAQGSTTSKTIPLQ